MFEDLGVFQRLGEATDVVTKEMYDFVDKGGRHIALRPEQTAGIVRAFVQHSPQTPWKVWYAGPNFRYEKPQLGRYRQFDQVGIEVLGVDDPYVDVEVVALASQFFEQLGLRRVTLLLNSLGNPDERARYVDALTAHFAADLDALSPESRVTLQKNPLRVIDSKREQDADLIAAAPLIERFYSDETAEHFATRVRRPPGSRRGVHARTPPRSRLRLLPPHDVRVRRRRTGGRAERRRRWWPLRRLGRGSGRSTDARHRLRARRRSHAARLRPRRRLRHARSRRRTSSSSTPPVAARR